MNKEQFNKLYVGDWPEEHWQALLFAKRYITKLESENKRLQEIEKRYYNLCNAIYEMSPVSEI